MKMENPPWTRKAADNSALDFVKIKKERYRDLGEGNPSKHYSPRILKGWPVHTDFTSENINARD